MHKRQDTFLDALCIQVDHVLKTLTVIPTASRSSPAAQVEEPSLTAAERQHAAGLMRVNHVGEVCAQALYQGQAAASQTPEVRQAMQQAIIEERDHLAWCEQRLQELDSHTSRLNPLWYLGSYLLGLTAGKSGDAWSLGFVVETENQVETHLASHLEQLPANDQRSRAIVKQMRIDEMQHADTAQASGARVLPNAVTGIMRGMAKIMTKTAYYL